MIDNVAYRWEVIWRNLRVFACVWAASLLLNPWKLGWLSFAAITLFSAFFAAVILKVFDGMTSDTVANLVFKGWGRAKVGYSQEQAMARQGDREGACQALKLRFVAEPEGEALRAMLHIAIQRPQMDRWAALACQGLLRMKRLPAEDRKHFENILSTLPLDPGKKYEDELFRI